MLYKMLTDVSIYVGQVARGLRHDKPRTISCAHVLCVNEIGIAVHILVGFSRG